ncbi:hypothetical protein ACSVDA_15680 [Cytobacillus sp. Hm23]
MKDKNGKVLYENDIVNARVSDTTNKRILVVVYDNERGTVILEK